MVSELVQKKRNFCLSLNKHLMWSLLDNYVNVLLMLHVNIPGILYNEIGSKVGWTKKEQGMLKEYYKKIDCYRKQYTKDKVLTFSQFFYLPITHIRLSCLS